MHQIVDLRPAPDRSSIQRPPVHCRIRPYLYIITNSQHPNLRKLLIPPRLRVPDISKPIAPHHFPSIAKPPANTTEAAEARAASNPPASSTNTKSPTFADPTLATRETTTAPSPITRPPTNLATSSTDLVIKCLVLKT